MSSLPSETPGSSTANQATPSLKDEACALDPELYAIGGACGGFDETDYTSKTDVDNIVETLFFAWQQFPPKKPNKPRRKNLDYFRPKAIRAMITAWRQIKADRHVLPESEEIVQGLVASIVEFMYPLQLNAPHSEGKVTREDFTVRVAEIVAECWQHLLNSVEEEDAKKRARKRRERIRKIRQERRRRQEVANVLSFYESMARIDNHVPFTCRIFCLFLCQLCSIFFFQFPIHTLLLAWPLSIAVMGGIYLTRCPMSYIMPYVMVASGCVGTIALLARLFLVFYKKFSSKETRKWPWIALKLTEFAFLDLLIIQLYYFFSKTPSIDPGSPDYCDQTFYNFVSWINFVSMALVSAWMFVYFVKGLLWMRGRNY